MEFRQRKLPKEATQNLRICAIETVRPFALMLAPVYVYMRANEKFISVKAPLDFFTSEELDRLKPLVSFFIPEFVDVALPFRQAGRGVRALLSWDPEKTVKPAGDDEVVMAPAPYEISDAVLQMIGPLWATGALIEPFFVAVFVNEICDLLPESFLRDAREASVIRFERAVFLSSWTVFLALHLGHCNLEFLNRLRTDVFTMTVEERVSGEHPENELIALAHDSFEQQSARRLAGDYFGQRRERVAQKLAWRLKRVKASLIKSNTPVASIYGEKGFADV